MSIDSEINLWDITTARCLKTYHGYKNDKNFVGLTFNGNHLVCGSEDNTVYCYYEDISKYILSYDLIALMNQDQKQLSQQIMPINHL